MDPSIIDTNVADPVEQEELFPDENAEIVDTMGVTRKIWAIRQLEKLLAMYDRQDAESRQFYAGRKTAAQSRIDFVKASIYAWLKHQDLQRLATPNGTAYFRSITMKQ